MAKRKLNEHDVPEESEESDASQIEPSSPPKSSQVTTTKTKTKKKNKTPATPIPTVSSFADLQLEPRLLRAIRDLKWASPTAVQAQAIPLALEGRDILARSGTGTGKTAAYLLPILHNTLQRKGQTSLILVPTKELALQVLHTH